MIGKEFPGQVSLDFCSDIWMAATKHPTSYHQFNLLLMVQSCGGYFLTHFGPLTIF